MDAETAVLILLGLAESGHPNAGKAAREIFGESVGEKALSSLDETSGGALRGAPAPRLKPRPQQVSRKFLPGTKVKGGCVRNRIGNRFHDTETGAPCSPGQKPQPAQKQPVKPQAPADPRTARQLKAGKRSLSRHNRRRWFREQKQGFAKGMKIVMGPALKKAGGVAKAVKLAAQWFGASTWNAVGKIPKVGTALQKTAAVAGAVGLQLEHSLEGFVSGSNKAVGAVAQQQGLNKRQAHFLKKFVGLADTALRWSVNIPVTHHGIEHLMHDFHVEDVEAFEVPHDVAGVGGTKVGGAFALAKIGYYVPVASLAYLGASAAYDLGKAAYDVTQAARHVDEYLQSDDKLHDPLRTLRTAAGFIRGGVWGNGEHHHDDGKYEGWVAHGPLLGKLRKIWEASQAEMAYASGAFQPKVKSSPLYRTKAQGQGGKAKLALTNKLAAALKEHDSDWFLALLASAMDSCGDLERALKIATFVVKEVPEPPETPVDETILNWMPVKLS